MLMFRGKKKKAKKHLGWSGNGQICIIA